jgi:selenobiotic family peptide radical SAM maturase
MKLETIFPACRSILGERIWQQIISDPHADSAPEALPGRFAMIAGDWPVPAYLGDLAALEWTIHATAGMMESDRGDAGETAINPTLSLVEVRWKNLTSLVGVGGESIAPPQRGDDRVLVWKVPGTGEVRTCVPTDEDLLVLKMLEEGIEAKTLAKMGGFPIRAVYGALDRAREKGLIKSPSTRIVREGDFGPDPTGDRTYLDAPVFTLQWHLTQACELRCRHCYDRTERETITFAGALEVLDDFDRFCRTKRVRGAITFTGGNPLLYPDFVPLYRAASEYGFAVAVLGNPTERPVLEELVSIQKPDFFQLSLEGLAEHDEWIRGPGHFGRTLRCLEVLRELGIYSMVMLTLTKDNLGQTIPLAQLLRERTDIFLFNRLSRVGMGAKLELPSREEYRSFLEEYVFASKENHSLGLKDNLTNIVLTQRGEAPFGGCTGFGCGAAFNFVALLADGEVHACRKFPSPVGNIHYQSLAEIYDSEDARRYRRRPQACSGCALRAVCGGCLAVIESNGLDISRDRDPFCFR